MKNLLVKFLQLSICFCMAATLHAEAAQLTHELGANLTPHEIRKITRDAYIFAYPLVMNYRTMYLQAIDPDSKSYAGGFGKWKHYDSATPENKDIVTPNVDTPYSWAWVDLRSGPWVLTMPSVDNRYYTSQVDDLWGYVLDNAGSVNDGNDGGSYLLVDYKWHGKTPAGIKRIIHGETKFLGLLNRTEFLGGGDIAAVRKIQQQYKLQPLAQFLAHQEPLAAPTPNWPQWTEGAEKTTQFFKYVNFLLPFTVTNEIDKPILERVALIGVISGANWEPEKLSSAQRAAMQKGIDDALALLDRNSEEASSSASFFGTRDDAKTYLDRATGVYAGMFGNVSTQALYLPWLRDKYGELLNAGKHDYTIVFPPNKTPDAKYFWSITMYSLPERLLVPNSAARYSISSRDTAIKKSPDGSITIYVQKSRPDDNNLSNWLPAPVGPFYAVLRTYGPAQEIVNGKWQPPVMEAH
jgi:hypothetical protein